jgi:hypothetical protein
MPAIKGALVTIDSSHAGLYGDWRGAVPLVLLLIGIFCDGRAGEDNFQCHWNELYWGSHLDLLNLRFGSGEYTRKFCTYEADIMEKLWSLGPNQSIR